MVGRLGVWPVGQRGGGREKSKKRKESKASEGVWRQREGGPPGVKRRPKAGDEAPAAALRPERLPSYMGADAGFCNGTDSESLCGPPFG